MGSPIVFGILAFIAVASALLMLLSRNAVHSALYLVLNFTTVGVLFLVLNAPFIAMVQITVYAGAIMVLFLFVIMLLGAERSGSESADSGANWQQPFAIVLAVMLIGVMAYQVLGAFGGVGSAVGTASGRTLDSSPAAIGQLLFENYVFPFELTSILLLVAMISIVVWRTQKRKTGKEG